MPDATGVMIELDRVSKRYGRRGAAPDAVSGVTLHVPAGAIWAVVGPNGAGKSTLLALVLGFLRPSDGDVRIDGEPPRLFLREHGAGYLPERFTLPASWRGRDALRLFARLDRAAADRVIDELELSDVLGRRVGELSRGMLQRLGLAQALLGPRRLIVLDEPTEGLDPLWRIRLRDLLRDLRDAGSTVLLASHDLDEVERVADRAAVMDRGVVRQVIDTRAQAAAAAYRIALAAPCPTFHDAFPEAVAESETSFAVSVSGPAELSERLGALLELGGVIAAVEPLRTPLEQRVRDMLDDHGGGAGP